MSILDFHEDNALWDRLTTVRIVADDATYFTAEALAGRLESAVPPGCGAGLRTEARWFSLSATDGPPFAAVGMRINEEASGISWTIARVDLVSQGARRRCLGRRTKLVRPTTFVLETADFRPDRSGAAVRTWRPVRELAGVPLPGVVVLRSEHGTEALRAAVRVACVDATGAMPGMRLTRPGEPPIFLAEVAEPTEPGGFYVLSAVRHPWPAGPTS